MEASSHSAAYETPQRHVLHKRIHHLFKIILTQAPFEVKKKKNLRFIFNLSPMCVFLLEI